MVLNLVKNGIPHIPRWMVIESKSAITSENPPTDYMFIDLYDLQARTAGYNPHNASLVSSTANNISAVLSWSDNTCKQLIFKFDTSNQYVIGKMNSNAKIYHILTLA